MLRTNLHRGVMAMVFASALALGGARPAAAQGPVWREAWDWLARLWSGVTLLQPVREAAGLEIDPNGVNANGDCGLEIDPNGCPDTQGGGDGGFEIDPNG